MATRPHCLLCCLVWPAGTVLHAQTINWYSVQGANKTSTGAVMTGAFSFELGAFKDGFVPGPANTFDWAAHWVPAQRVVYDASLKRFSSSFTADNNDAPFSAGAAAYVWGFQGGVASSEWILFRNTLSPWVWPDVYAFPATLFWNAATAAAVIGTIGANDTVMQSAAMANAASPPTTWQQWQSAELANEPLNDPDDDPDRDGTNNLLEYIFGTPPMQAGAPPPTPIAAVNGHLQITIPRRIDHPATLTVQVSSNLTDWDEGEGFTAVVSNTPAGLVVRDLTLLSAAHPQRFMRLKTELAAP
jgi:hypothetical protein